MTADKLVDGVVTAISAEVADTPAASFSMAAAISAVRQAAAGADSLDRVKEVAKLQVAAARQSLEAATQLLARLEQLELEQPPQPDPGVDVPLAEIDAIRAEPDPGRALWRWTLLYGRALAAGDLEARQRLTEQTFPFLRSNQELHAMVRGGTHALAVDDWPGAIRLLRFMAGVLATARDLEVDEPEAAPSNAAEVQRILATLLVLLGRVQLTQLRNPETALGWLRQASRAAPAHGLPHAARAEYYASVGEYGHGMPKARRAVERSPELPDGYVALGLCAEGQGVTTAARHYDRAIDLVWERPDPHAALRGLLAPASPALLARLAERAEAAGRWELALAAVDDALTVPAADEPDQARWRREAGHYEQQGRALRALGRPADAAQAFSNAGDRWVWLFSPGDQEPTPDQAEAIVRLLTEAAALDSRSARPWRLLVWWRLSQAVEAGAEPGERPRVDEARLKQALSAWATAVSLAAPVDPWDARNLASINEQLARVPGEDRPERLWAAVAAAEHAVLLDPGDAWSLAWLGRCLRLVEAPAAAEQALDMAVAHQPDHALAREERLVLLANGGRWQEAQRALEELPPGPWVDAVRAFVLVHTGHPEQALPLIQHAIDKTPAADSWMYSVREDCNRRLGQTEQIRNDQEEIWRRRDVRDREEQLTYAWAGYHLGHYPEALSYADPLRTVPLERDEALRVAGCCRVAMGEPAGWDELAQGIREASRTMPLAEFVERELGPLEILAGKSLDHPAESVSELRRLVAARLRELEVRLTPVEELDRVVRESLDPARWSWVAATAGLARLAGEQGGHWREAGEAYLRLAERAPAYLGGPLGHARAVTRLRQLGDEALRRADTEGAAEAYDATLSLLAGPALGEPAERAGLHAGRALVELERAGPEAAAGELAAAFRAYGDAGGVEVGRALRALLRDAAHYWTVRTAWPELAASEHLGKVRDALAAAWEQLAWFLEEPLERPKGGEAPPEAQPYVVPIALELGRALVPEDTSAEAWPLLGRLIPDMQARVEQELGVPVPGLRLRLGQRLDPGAYRILLDETPVASGRVDPDGCYDPRPSTASELPPSASAPGAVRDPLTGREGRWVLAGNADAASAAPRTALQGPSEYLIRHVEAVVRANLAAFLDVQAVDGLIEPDPGIADDAFSPEAADAPEVPTVDRLVRVVTLLPDVRSRLRFARLLRELVRDGVPINGWLEILDAAQGEPLAEEHLDVAVRKLRWRLRAKLPGNQPDVHRFSLPPAWEEALTGSGVPAAPESLSEHMAAIVAYVAAREEPAALVTGSAERQPLLRRLLAADLPNLQVLAVDELVTEETPPLLPTGVESGSGAHAAG